MSISMSRSFRRGSSGSGSDDDEIIYHDGHLSDLDDYDAAAVVAPLVFVRDTPTRVQGSTTTMQQWAHFNGGISRKLNHIVSLFFLCFFSVAPFVFVSDTPTRVCRVLPPKCNNWRTTTAVSAVG
jgi:hypothetical protein